MQATIKLPWTNFNQFSWPLLKPAEGVTVQIFAYIRLVLLSFTVSYTISISMFIRIAVIYEHIKFLSLEFIQTKEYKLLIQILNGCK